MAREWKPGDVARFDFGGSTVPMVGVRVAACVHDNHTNRGPHWHLSSGGWTQYDDRARPLAVIDPEDMEAVSQLMGHFSRADGAIYGKRGVDNMQAALREFAEPKPPRPDEPTGLGAVVEDENGARWTRVGVNGMWMQQGVVGGCLYDDVRAVRVLAAGLDLDA
jgi:hypothetical protein